MDDKATLKPGTDIGVKGARRQEIIMPSNQEGLLPQHDFSESKVQITPSSFTFMTKKVDTESNEATCS